MKHQQDRCVDVERSRSYDDLFGLGAPRGGFHGGEFLLLFRVVEGAVELLVEPRFGGRSSKESTSGCPVVLMPSNWEPIWLKPRFLRKWYG